MSSVLAEEAISRGYSIESLENGIKKCRENVAMLEQAADRERDTIKEYRIMIDALATAADQKKAAQDGVHVEVAREDGESG